MRVLALAALALAACVVSVEAATAGRSPRFEKLALRALDTKRASGALLKLSDLMSGWKGGAVDPNSSAGPDCAEQDFSPYTITGQAEADFEDDVTLLISVAQLFPTNRQSLADFGVGTRAGTVTCEGAAFRKDFGPSAKLVSARQVVAPKVGQRAAAYEYVIKVSGMTYYASIIQFVRGRALAAVIAVRQGHRLVGPKTLARIMDERLQVGTA